LSGNVIGLFQKSSPELPVFSKKVRVARGKFRKKSAGSGSDGGKGYPPPAPVNYDDRDPFKKSFESPKPTYYPYF